MCVCVPLAASVCARVFLIFVFLNSNSTETAAHHTVVHIYIDVSRFKVLKREWNTSSMFVVVAIETKTGSWEATENDGVKRNRFLLHFHFDFVCLIWCCGWCASNFFFIYFHVNYEWTVDVYVHERRKRACSSLRQVTLFTFYEFICKYVLLLLLLRLSLSLMVFRCCVVRLKTKKKEEKERKEFFFIRYLHLESWWRRTTKSVRCMCAMRVCVYCVVRYGKWSPVGGTDVERNSFSFVFMCCSRWHSLRHEMLDWLLNIDICTVTRGEGSWKVRWMAAIKEEYHRQYEIESEITKRHLQRPHQIHWFLRKRQKEKMSKQISNKFKPIAWNTIKSEQKPTYETILQRLNAYSCAQVSLREPVINKDTNSNNQMEYDSNERNNNGNMHNHNSNGALSNGSRNAVYETPTPKLYLVKQEPDQQHQLQLLDYQKQHCLQLQSSPSIISSIETLVSHSYLHLYFRYSFFISFCSLSNHIHIRADYNRRPTI